jgi:hypothetical protein
VLAIVPRLAAPQRSFAVLRRLAESSREPEPERLMPYPQVWEGQYKRNGIVEEWREFPELCDERFGKFGTCGTNMHMNKNGMGCFAEYALMYLLRKREGSHSITYFELGARLEAAIHNKRTKRVKPEVARRREHLQGILRVWMGVADFEKLRNAIWDFNAKSNYSLAQSRFKGEPDLFCYEPSSGKCFFCGGEA